MLTITYQGGATITPYMALLDTAAFASEPRTVVHDVLDGPPVYSLRPAGPVRGVLVIGFLSEQAATDAWRVHMVPAIFEIADTESASLNFRYVVSGGDIELAIEDQTANAWVLRVPYVEVS